MARCICFAIWSGAEICIENLGKCVYRLCLFLFLPPSHSQARKTPQWWWEQLNNDLVKRKCALSHWNYENCNNKFIRSNVRMCFMFCRYQSAHNPIEKHFSVWMDSQPAIHIISSETNRFVPCHTLHTSHRLNFYMKHVAIIIQTISLYRHVAWVEFLIEILNAYV